MNRQSPALEENWSFIHFVEAIDTTPKYEIYLAHLIKANKTTPNLTSLILLNRHINASSGSVRARAVSLLKTISENNSVIETVRNEARAYYHDQLEKKSV